MRWENDEFVEDKGRKSEENAEKWLNLEENGVGSVV